jgi:hypothetical protein
VPFPHPGVGATLLPWGYAHHAQAIAPAAPATPATPPPTPIPNTIALQAAYDVQGDDPSRCADDLDNHECMGVGCMDSEKKVVAAPAALQPKKKGPHDEIREGGEFLS